MTSAVAGRYAEGTTVAAEKSRGEIERILTRYGAEAFGYLTDGDRAAIEFRANGRRVRFLLPLPDITDFRVGRGYRTRTEAQQRAARDAEIRRRWRALALAIKAKLEVVESEIATFEEEFLPHIVLPNGGTVSDWLVPQINDAYETNQMPPGLTLALPPGGTTTKENP